MRMKIIYIWLVILGFGSISNIVYASDENPSQVAKEYFKYLHGSEMGKAANLHLKTEIEQCQKILKPKIKELQEKGDKTLYFGMRYYGNNEAQIDKVADLDSTHLFGYALFSASLYIVSLDNMPRVIGHTIEGDRAFVVFEQMLKLKNDESKNKKDYFVLILKKTGDTWKVTLDETVNDFCYSVIKTLEVNRTSKKWTIN